MTPDQKIKAPRERRIGRPSKDKNRKMYYEGTLHELLARRLAHRDNLVRVGRVDVNALSRAVGRCGYTVYGWFNNNKISPAGAKKLIELSRDPKNPDIAPLTIEELAPFLIV